MSPNEYHEYYEKERLKAAAEFDAQRVSEDIKRDTRRAELRIEMRGMKHTMRHYAIWCVTALTILCMLFAANTVFLDIHARIAADIEGWAIPLAILNWMASVFSFVRKWCEHEALRTRYKNL